MTIREFAAMLDDYTGSLVQEVEKLEIERTRGILNLNEQMDLVGDLREAVKARRIRPWRKKALLALIPGAVLVAVSAMPFGPLWNGLLRLVAGILGGLLILWGIYGFWMVLKFKKLECKWLRRVEENLRQGGTVFDFHER